MTYMFYGCSGDAFNPDVSNWDVSSVTNMSYMFSGCSRSAFRGGRGEGEKGIEKWTPNSLSSVTTSGLAQFMLSSRKQEDGFLDSILIAWAALIGDTENPLPENVTCHFGTNKYTAAALDAIDALEAHGTTGWIITSGGLPS